MTFISYAQNFEDVMLQRALKHVEAGFAERFEQAKAEGDLPQQADSKQLAKYVATIHQGMSVQASTGATREELLALVEMAMKSWPTAI